MASAKTVWGIDIGQCALKALKLSVTPEGEVQVDAFDIIEHPKILSQPDADRTQLIHNALEQFLARNSIGGAAVAVSVPGQASFARFVKLPPVETKKIPEIVRFEAEQQIPFPIDEVVWRWQTFADADSPDVEVGLFAMKRVDLNRNLQHFTDVELDVDIVQMAPLALYNFLLFDEQLADGGATILIDVGAEQTDLVIAEPSRIWTRSIQIGGNNFTEALVRSFKLSFAKAEKLKRTAATSKYARQIFQAMRPVFADLVQEIQRSVGFYNSLHRDARFTKMVGMGNGFRLPGLQKFLEQNLNMPVVRVDTFNRVRPSPAVNAPVFTENVPSFAVAYGLGIQALGEGEIGTNLLPGEISRQRTWASKKPWFAAAAAALLAFLAVPLGRAYVDRAALADNRSVDTIQQRLDQLQRTQQQWQQVRGQEQQYDQDKARYLALLDYRHVWPGIEHLLFQSMQNVASSQRKLMLSGGDAREFLRTHPRQDQRLMLVESVKSEYQDDLDRKDNAPEASMGGGGFGGGAAKPKQEEADNTPKRRGFVVTMTVHTPLSQDQAIRHLLTPLKAESQRLAQQFEEQGIRLVALPDARFGESARGSGSGSSSSSSDASFIWWTEPKDPQAARGAIRGDDPSLAAAAEAEEAFVPQPPLTRFTLTWKIAIVDKTPEPTLTADAR